MNTLSRRCRYALRALYGLADQHTGDPTPVSEIARREHIPRKFLETILVQLRNASIVEGRQGKKGGYVLRQSPTQITMGAVIRAIDGPLALLPCASETAYRKCEECPDENSCETRLVMKEVRDAVAGILDRTTLADARDRAQSRRARPVTYDI